MGLQIKRGYIPVKRTRTRKYPFDKLKEGDYLSHFPWEDRDKVKYAMQKWNRDTQGKLHMSRYPTGSEEIKEPHVIVGWPKAGK